MSVGNGESGDLSAPEERIRQLDIRKEMTDSYMQYAMSVIVSRALPDARDGLKPSQRRILVAMGDLNLGPATNRVKCAKICGDTSGNYHPHGEGSVYPTLVRLAQNWVMRETLVDKQGNFGSLAGLPAAAMRYTEARLSSAASDLLADIQYDTVDFIPTYDQSRTEPVVLPSKFPNLLVNGSTGIAVGMATSIPPHNLGEVADAVTVLIDNEDASIDEIIEVLPGPDFPTGGVICGRYGIRKGYQTGRSTLTLRAKTHFEKEKNSDVIVVTEIPYLDTRDRIREKLELLVRDEKVKGISRIVDLTDRKTPTWQVRLHIVLKKGEDPDVILNQLYRFSPLQTTVSVIMLALVGQKPATLNIKEMLQEFIRHRVNVIRRRTEFLLAEARKRKHTVEGLMIAQVDIDQIIATIRAASSRAQAREDLQQIEVPAEMVARALGEEGFQNFLEEYGERSEYSLSANQAEAIVSMQLGSLANLEREKLQGEYQKLLEDIAGYLHLLADEAHILAVVREDMQQLKSKYSDKRRTEISDEELTDVNKDDLITEETMVVTLSQNGYIKRTTLATYQAQGRGGKGITGGKNAEEDAMRHLFVASTHAYLLFFTNLGKVYWQKVYDIPLQGRTAKGRALINLLNLDEGEEVENCIAVKEFTEDRFLVMATRNGIVKKTSLTEYSRPKTGGLIAIRLKEGDELVDVIVVGPGDDVLLSTSSGMAIRFPHTNARPMGRATAGVRGIKLGKNDQLIGIVVARTDRFLLTACENGYGKRTPFGLGGSLPDSASDDESDADAEAASSEAVEAEGDSDSGEGSEERSGHQYRSQNRGGKGLRDIRTTARNGKAVAILGVTEDDDVLMVTARGKIQRVRAAEISIVGRNTQGVRIIRLDDDDSLASMARIPGEIIDAAERDAAAAAEMAQAEDSAESDAVEDDSSENTDAGTEPDVESPESEG